MSTEKRRVLVIAYYFPPMGLSGVQRTLKFVKYLSDFGWMPTVITITPQTYFAFDESFLTELVGRDFDVIRTNAIDPAKVFKQRKTVKLKNEFVRKILNRISQFFFIPDNKIMWKKSAIEYAMKEAESNKYDIIFSTAPPYTDHLVAVEIKKRTGIPLVTDFRDSWLDNPYHFYWTPIHRRMHYDMERKVIKASNLIITINRNIKEKLVARHSDILNMNSIKIFSQGFDQEDFDKCKVSYEPNNQIMHWVYTGIFYERNTPIPLYKALSLLKTTYPDVYAKIKFDMVGYVQNDYVNQTKALQISELFTYHGYQEHPVVIEWLTKADALWLSLGVGKGYESISTGKVYEYLGSKKPILAITPNNDAAKLLRSFPVSKIVDPGLTEQIRDAIVEMYLNWKSKKTLPAASDVQLQQIERKFIASQLAKEFNMIASLADNE